MDLDQVLFGLDSFVASCEDDTLNADSIYVETYTTLLDQLAVLLRDETTRSNDLIRQNLLKLVHSAGYVLARVDTPGLRPLVLEILRVLANSVADNHVNRGIIVGDTVFVHQLGKQLEENFDDDEVNERVLIFLKNLVIDSPDITKVVASLITKNLLVYTSYENTFLSIDLLTDLVPEYQYDAEVKNIERFAKKFLSYIQKRDDSDEDEYSEMIVNTAGILEDLTLDQRLDFKDEYHETSTQESLFQCLEQLHPLEFQNKLMAQRKIFGSIGNVSANPSASNKPLIEDCLKNIQDTRQENGYILSASMAIIGNSIGSSADRTNVLERAPTLITDVLIKYNYLVDPVQFQGLLHILKSIVSFDTISQLFTDDNVKILAQVIEATVRNSKYYTNFTALLVAFLKKTIVHLGKSQVLKLSHNNIIDSLLSADSNYEFNTIILLLINKIAVYGTETDLQPLVTRALEFKDPNIPASYIFELTKTVGVLVKNKPEYVFAHHTEGVITLLNTVQTIISGPNASDNVSKAIHNNSRFIAGSILALNKDKEIDPRLFELCEIFMRA